MFEIKPEMTERYKYKDLLKEIAHLQSLGKRPPVEMLDYAYLTGNEQAIHLLRSIKVQPSFLTLNYAIIGGNPKLIHMALVDAKRMKNGLSDAFNVAIHYQKLDALGILMQEKVLPNANALNCALVTGNIAIIKQVIDYIHHLLNESKELNSKDPSIRNMINADTLNCAMTSNNILVINMALDIVKPNKFSLEYFLLISNLRHLLRMAEVPDWLHEKVVTHIESSGLDVYHYEQQMAEGISQEEEFVEYTDALDTKYGITNFKKLILQHQQEADNDLSDELPPYEPKHDYSYLSIDHHLGERSPSINNNEASSNLADELKHKVLNIKVLTTDVKIKLPAMMPPDDYAKDMVSLLGQDFVMRHFKFKSTRISSEHIHDIGMYLIKVLANTAQTKPEQLLFKINLAALQEIQTKNGSPNHEGLMAPFTDALQNDMNNNGSVNYYHGFFTQGRENVLNLMRSKTTVYFSLCCVMLNYMNKIEYKGAEITSEQDLEAFWSKVESSCDSEEFYGFIAHVIRAFNAENRLLTDDVPSNSPSPK